MTTGELGMLLLMGGAVFGIFFTIEWCKHEVKRKKL
jgi:hypothetical protein